ncbi:hypothetical protein HanRHA438_Chr17g0841891 [Helianthus annuus]|nr:hypothetical protein HanRHA438_Chr17g0841891 [Helianthus annuus]
MVNLENNWWRPTITLKSPPPAISGVQRQLVTTGGDKLQVTGCETDISELKAGIRWWWLDLLVVVEVSWIYREREIERERERDRWLIGC